MPSYTATITTPRTSEDAFDYLANFASVAEWDPGVSEAEPLDGGGGPDARFRVVARFLGRDVPLVYRTIEFDRPHRVVLEASSDSIVSTDTITVRPDGAGRVAVTYDADLRLEGAMRLAELPMRIAFRRIGERARAGLERALR